MKGLSNRQKSVIAQIARHAYEKLTASNKITGIDFDTWRHDEVERCTGKPGLRACGNDHYRPLCAHFESLVGEEGKALNHLLADGTNQRRQLEHVLVAALNSAGLPVTYAEKISRDKFKRGVMDTTDAQLRAILITVKARATSRRRKAAHPRPSVGRGKGEGIGSLNSHPSTPS